LASSHFQSRARLRHHLKHHFDTVGLPGLEEKSLGSGPWKFVKREIGQFIKYEANLDY
jgi:peptide/nickel transport system substrate-binding protein